MKHTCVGLGESGVSGVSDVFWRVESAESTRHATSCRNSSR